MRRLDYFLAGLGGALIVALLYVLSPSMLEAVQYPGVRLTDNAGAYVGSVANPLAVTGTARVCSAFDVQATAPATGTCGNVAGAVTDVVNCGTETDFYYKTIPAGLLTPTGSMTIMLVGDYLQNGVATDTLRIRAMGAGNQIASFGTSNTVAQGVNRHIVQGEFTISGQTVTSALMATGQGFLGVSANNTSGGVTLQSWTTGLPNVVGVDSATGFLLELRVLLTTANAAIEYRSQYVRVSVCS